MELSYEEQVNNAYNLHISGRVEEAKIEYEKLLEIKKDDLDVLNLYALVNFALKNYEVSLKIFRDLYEKTKLDDIKINILKVYLQMQNYEAAIETVKTFQTKSEELLNLTVKAYEGLNDFENALKCALELYEKNNTDVNICVHISAIYGKLNDIENQIKYLEKAAQTEPSTELLYNLGVLCRLAHKEEKSLEYLKEVLEKEPEHKFALLNIARLYQDCDKHIALQLYEELLKKYPDDKMILFQIYSLQVDITDYKAACDTAVNLIQLAPEEGIYYSCLADSLYKLGRYEEAVEMYKNANKSANDKHYIDSQIAYIYSITNQGEKAVQIYKTHYPELLKTSQTYGMIQLREKNLEEGRHAMHEHLIRIRSEEELDKKAMKAFYKLGVDKKYGINEAEFKKFKTDYSEKINKRTKYYLKKDLFGNNPDNKRILVYSANGAGDIIMFSRYLHTLEKHTKNILLQPVNSMQRILKHSFGDYKIYDENETVDESNYDYSCSFFNLLCALEENSLKDIPFSKGYLSIDEKLIKEKSQFDIMKTDKKKIGLFWMGNPSIMPQRSIKLNELKPIFEIPNTQIYSFQIDKNDFESEQIKNNFPMIEPVPYIKDFADTAAFIKNIDILVTIDSAIANLAGAMGIKTFLLLPFETEWRWFHDTETTPWYDSVKIFKQKVPYDWGEVIERVKNGLKI